MPLTALRLTRAERGFGVSFGTLQGDVAQITRFAILESIYKSHKLENPFADTGRAYS
jgi:hypothetical protein